MTQSPTDSLVLAVEASTCRPSIALLRGSCRIAGEQWDIDDGRHQELCKRLDRILRQADVTCADIRTFAVGLGPGGFSSLRMALAAVQGMALPHRTPVVGISSAHILARELMQEMSLPALAVVGDARRGFVWVTLFDELDATLTPDTNIRLMEPNDLRHVVRSDMRIVTPDWDRIGPQLRAAVPKTQLVCQARCPSAAVLAGMALIPTAMQTSSPTSPLTPVYVRPPVSTPPRFPA